MELILKFMYFGETTVFLERSVEFLRVARDLEMSELCDLHDEQLEHYQDQSQDCDPPERKEEEKDTEQEVEAMSTLSETVSPLSPSSLQYICQRCGLRFLQVARHDKKRLLYYCHFCNEKFQQKWRLSKHVHHIHDEFQMICKKDNCLPKLLQKQ